MTAALKCTTVNWSCSLRLAKEAWLLNGIVSNLYSPKNFFLPAHGVPERSFNLLSHSLVAAF